MFHTMNSRTIFGPSTISACPSSPVHQAADANTSIRTQRPLCMLQEAQEEDVTLAEETPKKKEKKKEKKEKKGEKEKKAFEVEQEDALAEHQPHEGVPEEQDTTETHEYDEDETNYTGGDEYNEHEVRKHPVTHIPTIERLLTKHNFRISHLSGEQEGVCW